MRRGVPQPQAGDAGSASSAGSEASTELAHAEIPVATVSALRLGQVLVAEVPAPIGRRAWVAIRPASEPEDAAAQQQGWKRSSRAREFSVRHAEYLVEHLDGLDYDIGMRQVADARVAGEEALWRLLADWGVAPSELDYPWRSDFPE